MSTGSSLEVLLGIAGSVVSIGDDLKNQTITSASKPMIIPSRIYIDEAIFNDDVTPDVMRSAQEFYVSLLINLLNLGELVDDAVTLGERLKPLATESLDAITIDVGDQFDAFCGAIEEVADKSASNGGVREVTTNDEGKPLPQNRTVKFTFTGTANGVAKSVDVHLLVQLRPYVIPSNMVSQFIQLNVPMTLRQRVAMMRAGEIGLIKDFFFNIDKFKRKKLLIRNDPDGVIAEYLESQNAKSVAQMKRLRDRVLMAGQSMSRSARASNTNNLANTVMIFSQESIDQAKADTGFNIHDFSQREKFFSDTFAMFIYVIDPAYGQIESFVSGYKDVGKFRFDQFRPKGKSNDISDITKLIEALGGGRMPPRL